MTVRTETVIRSLTFVGTRLDLELEPGVDITAALDFLGTHLAAGPADAQGSPALATLHVAAAESDRQVPPAGTRWEDIYVRKSASEFFTVPARRAEAHGREYLECTKTGTRFAFDRAARTIDVVVGDDGAMDLVELIRDLVLKDQENSGAAVLHATAAYRDGTAVLITGAKGAGKSTILLELVERFGYQIMSGDKTVLHEQPDGSVLASGWPDYPHIGYGTIAKYAGLREIAGLADGYEPAADHAFSPVGKFAVDPVRFRERFPSAPRGVRAPVSAIIHPSIGPGDRTVLAACAPDPQKRVASLDANVESAFDGANAGWHHYLTDARAAQADRRRRITAALATVPAWLLTGPGDLTADDFPLPVAEASAA
ncbi:hypothetical protein [Streptomyces spectabilis]|uniref:HprK-related kinase B n=1 Tax=Streptomyces spectabilis TaxID=68270 RepID=A0A516RH73_STRST|nr:hypothetical protein [Streptomyces spectabilis]QDQ14997.1 hypothetical protein FH965_34305 [Streptomyces spectabilis]